MFQNILVPTKIVAAEARLSDNQVTDIYHRTDEHTLAILPEKPEHTGKPRLFSGLQFGMFCLLADLMGSGVKGPLAARIARRVMDAHHRDASVEQWSIVVLENGNVSTLPYNSTELRSGFISGARLAFALVIDLRLYAERVERAIADAPRVIAD
ncbi:hypothetical protein KY084_04060 [Stakelama sp. CBK3Z-3]|uniref:Uncharacterized protein n=1 Tax=Stakelama flava TaxID=2860338 RepID=A0ABS6XIN2_9SPHN|nr:hypothetical protein [Stakelama flava]MBW4330047.1 hypothetical protein [Stakelama flava]